LAKIKIFFSLRRFIKSQHISSVIKSEFVVPPLFFRLNNVQTATLFHGCFHYYSFSFRKRMNLWGANNNIILSSKEIDKWEGILHNISVIPNMLIPIQYEAEVSKEKIILAIGHLNRNKDFERLIKAYLPLVKTHPDWRLVIVGEGIEAYSLQLLIDSEGANQQIEIIPPTNRIETLYAKSSIFALSSHLEGFPMVLVEAMSFGVPCVSFDIPTGPSDIIQEGVNGLLVPDGDEAAMKNALAQLMSNSHLCQEMGQYAKQSVTRFSEEVIMAKWLKIIEE
jgi:glycosyltransferase involved in cell wall biosynthesis